MNNQQLATLVMGVVRGAKSPGHVRDALAFMRDTLSGTPAGQGMGTEPPLPAPVGMGAQNVKAMRKKYRAKANNTPQQSWPGDSDVVTSAGRKRTVRRALEEDGFLDVTAVEGVEGSGMPGDPIELPESAIIDESKRLKALRKKYRSKAEGDTPPQQNSTESAPSPPPTTPSVPAPVVPPSSAGSPPPAEPPSSPDEPVLPDEDDYPSTTPAYHAGEHDEGESFRAELEQNPDDQTLRNIYADWLEDNAHLSEDHPRQAEFHRRVANLPHEELQDILGVRNFLLTHSHHSHNHPYATPDQNGQWIGNSPEYRERMGLAAELAGYGDVWQEALRVGREHAEQNALTFTSPYDPPQERLSWINSRIPTMRDDALGQAMSNHAPPVPIRWDYPDDESYRIADEDWREAYGRAIAIARRGLAIGALPVWLDENGEYRQQQQPAEAL